MASNSVANRLKKLTIEERAEIKEKFTDVSIELNACICSKRIAHIFFPSVEIKWNKLFGYEIHSDWLAHCVVHLANAVSYKLVFKQKKEKEIIKRPDCFDAARFLTLSFQLN